MIEGFSFIQDKKKNLFFLIFYKCNYLLPPFFLALFSFLFLKVKDLIQLRFCLAVWVCIVVLTLTMSPYPHPCLAMVRRGGFVDVVVPHTTD